MYATNNNVQAVESRCRTIQSLLALMKAYPYSEITITQICQEAKIVRPTFYRNFDFKEDILRLYLKQMIQEYHDSYYQQDDIHAQLNSFFQFMMKNKKFLLLTKKNALFFMIDEAIAQNITMFIHMKQCDSPKDPRFDQYISGFIASTICSLLSLWAKRGFMESSDVMSKLAKNLLSGVNCQLDF